MLYKHLPLEKVCIVIVYSWTRMASFVSMKFYLYTVLNLIFDLLMYTFY